MWIFNSIEFFIHHFPTVPLCFYSFLFLFLDCFGPFCQWVCNFLVCAHTCIHTFCLIGVFLCWIDSGDNSSVGWLPAMFLYFMLCRFYKWSCGYFFCRSERTLFTKALFWALWGHILNWICHEREKLLWQLGFSLGVHHWHLQEEMGMTLISAWA